MQNIERKWEYVWYRHPGLRSPQFLRNASSWIFSFSFLVPPSSFSEVVLKLFSGNVIWFWWVPQKIICEEIKRVIGDVALFNFFYIWWRYCLWIKRPTNHKRSTKRSMDSNTLGSRTMREAKVCLLGVSMMSSLETLLPK